MELDFAELQTALALQAAYEDVKAMERISFADTPQVFNGDEHSKQAFLSFCIEAWGEQGIADGILARGDLTYVRQVQ